MGTIIHHAIVVTSNQGDYIDRAAAYARELGLVVVGPQVEPTGNMNRSFMVCPDGHKEYNDFSEAGDERRAKLKAWLRREWMDVEWAEVAYGNDLGGDGAAHVTACGWNDDDGEPIVNHPEPDS
jgi:hypothetical protein